jgi:cellulose synthase/poly-beta-1,6-N-acetylglucosamine synthase-like glycosyltransferase
VVLYFFFSLLITVAYAILITAYHLAWRAIPVLQLSPAFKPQTFISVVIAVRNEEASIANCVQSILLNNYPKQLFEIIIVDDYSSDSTIEKLNRLNSKMVNWFSLSETEHTEGGKKAALLYGIQQAKGTFIVTTDGDCLVQNNWLMHFAYHFEKMGKKCLSGMVRLQPVSTFVENFQALDNLASMGVNAAANYFSWHFAGNGANLGFEKALFFRLGAYTGNEHISSGDDMFLIQKIANENPALIAPIKHPDHIVNTVPETTWTALFQQRVRWATKTTAYKDKRMIIVYGFLFLFQSLLVLNLMLSIFFGQIFFLLFIIQLLIKGLIDYLILHTLSDFFDQKEIRPSFLRASIYLIPFFIILSIKALVTKSYSWKGRTVK